MWVGCVTVEGRNVLDKHWYTFKNRHGTWRSVSSWPESKALAVSPVFSESAPCRTVALPSDQDQVLRNACSHTHVAPSFV